MLTDNAISLENKKALSLLLRIIRFTREGEKVCINTRVQRDRGSVIDKGAALCPTVDLESH